MRTLIVTISTLAMAGALVSTFAAASDSAAPGPRVTDLEVFVDGLTFVAAGSFAGFSEHGGSVQVQLKARGLVTGRCLGPNGAGARRFAVPLVLKGTATTRPIGRGEVTFFARTAVPRLASVEVCPGRDWSVQTSSVEFAAAKLQIARADARVICQFPAVDGPVADPGCHVER